MKGPNFIKSIFRWKIWPPYLLSSLNLFSFCNPLYALHLRSIIEIKTNMVNTCLHFVDVKRVFFDNTIIGNDKLDMIYC